MYQKVVICMISIVYLASGCTTDPVILDRNINVSGNTSKSCQCRINLLDLSDARRNKQDLGKVSRRFIRNDEILAWIKEGMKTFNIVSYGVNQPSRQTVGVEVSLIAAHARSVHTSMCCTVALEVVFSHKNKPIERKFYRGSHTCINWISGINEIDSCLDRALEQVLTKLSKDACLFCQEPLYSEQPD